MGLLLKIISFLLLFSSCSNIHSNKQQATFHFDSENSVIDDTGFKMDKMKVVYGDTLVIFRYYKDHILESYFFKLDSNLYEYRYDYNDEGVCFGVDSILTFSINDTIFIYKSRREFIPIVIHLALADCKYEIKKSKEGYMTTKQSLIDSTYKEIYYYDMHYNLSKFVNTYKKNVCIYIKSE